MALKTFFQRWTEVKQDDNMRLNISEKSLFVEPWKKPNTQRQLNLYNYFIFIEGLIAGDRYRDVLEIGCGRGTMSLYIKIYLDKNLTLLDKESGAVDLAKEEFQKRNLTADFCVGDALDTRLADESFDAVVSIGLAEHIDDVGRLYREQYSLLRSGGIMISFNVPKKFSVQVLNTAMRLVKKFFGKYKNDVRSDYYRNSLQAEDYARIAKEIGFGRVEIVHVCPFPIFTPISMSLDEKITKVYDVILALRRIFQKYPYKTNSVFSQAHFLIGYK